MKTSTKNNLLTSLAIIFVFTSVAQDKTQVKYFTESNRFFDKPTFLSFSKELVGKDTNNAHVYKVNYINDKIISVKEKLNHKTILFLQFIIDDKNNYKELIKYDGNYEPGVGFPEGFTIDDNFRRNSKTVNKLNGKVTYITSYKYDSLGREVEIVCFDKFGQKIEVAYYEKDDKLIDVYGIAIKRYTYDFGSIIEEAYYDKEDKLIGDGKNIAIYRFKYGNVGKKIEEAYYDKEDKLIEGTAITRNKYDNIGNLIETATYDKEEKLIGDYSGTAIYRYKFDNQGREIETATYDKEDKLIDNLDGIAIRKKIFVDENQYEMIFFNNKEKQISSKQGFYKVRYVDLDYIYYNKKGKEVFYNEELDKYE